MFDINDQAKMNIDDTDPFICGTPSGAPTIAFVALLILSICIGSVYAIKHPARPEMKIYDRAVNDTLDTTLQVGSEWRSERRKFTWNDIQLEVARRAFTFNAKSRGIDNTL